MPADYTPTGAAETPPPLTFRTIDLSQQPSRSVRCRNCRLHIEPGLTLRAAFACPRFGKPRAQHSGPCASFLPKPVLP